MALQVWLPLTGHLENQGLSDITVTNNGATVDNSGKLGKCYSFGTTSSYLTIPESTMTSFTDECTVSFWLYIISWNTAYATFFQAGTGSSPWNNYVFGVLRNNQTSKLCFTITNSGNTSSRDSYLTPDLSLNTWYHLTFVYKTGHCLIYVNGTLHQDYTTTIVPKFNAISKITMGTCNNISSYQTNCKMQDVRIYDHALSPKEIKLLSQGLVAHYKLSELVQPNLFKGALKSFTPTAYLACQINLSENLTADTTYTVQLWDVNVSHTGKSASQLSVVLYWGGASVSLVSWTGSNFTNGHADYLTKTFTVTSSQASGSGASNAWINVYNSVPSATGDKYLTIGKWKLEKGSVATPWTPNSSDIYYSAENVVFDSSGYNNHLTAVNSPTIASDTARYSVSTHFNNGQYIIANENSNTGWLPTDSITVNLWTYITTWGNPISCTEGGGWNFEDAGGSSGIRFPIYVKGVGYVYKNSGVTTTSLLNGWHMLTGTFDKTTSKIYVDGELKGETTASTSNIIQYSSARLCISAEAQGTTPASSTMVGNISDVRIYATALSAEDIQQLYNAPVSVSNNGAMFTQGEFIES